MAHSTSDDPIQLYQRRRRLEAHLLEATKFLPNHAGLSNQRLSYLDALFSRKAPIPTTEEEVDADDRTRRQAVLELFTARLAAGFEKESVLKKWQNIVNMQESAKHALWQQRAYIVATLDERDDKGDVAKAEEWMAEGKSLRHLLAATIKSGPGREGFKALHIDFIEYAFSTQVSGLSDESIAKRRDAKILLLRARLAVGLYEAVDEELKWEGRDLPDPDEMTTEEMPDDEKGEVIGVVAENETETMGSALEPAYGREAAPSPDRIADPRASSPPLRARREYTPIPLSP